MSILTLDPLARAAVRLGSALERWGRARAAAIPDRDTLIRERARWAGVDARLVAAERAAPRIR